jgi:hypothetical protein
MLEQFQQPGDVRRVAGERQTHGHRSPTSAYQFGAEARGAL